MVDKSVSVHIVDGTELFFWIFVRKSRQLPAIINFMSAIWKLSRAQNCLMSLIIEIASWDHHGVRCAHCNANISTDRCRLMFACAPLCFDILGYQSTRVHTQTSVCANISLGRRCAPGLGYCSAGWNHLQTWPVHAQRIIACLYVFLEHTTHQISNSI